MRTYIYQNAWCWVLILASIALLIVILRLWATRKKKKQLEKDKTGYWRYHKDSKFTVKTAYGSQLDQGSDAEQSDSKSSEEPKGKKSKQKSTKKKKSVAVLKFDGDLRAKQHDSFARLVDEVALNAERLEEVVVLINSPGGMVPHYGHVYAEMERLRNTEIPLTVCVDVVAASGGYLASVPANRILAAPFAMIGSIGVAAFVPNFRRLLTRLDINPRTFTAGKYKRTVTLTDDATPAEVERFQEQLESIQTMFASAVKKYRPQIEVDEVATGDHWTAAESIDKNLGLIDDISTSHEYLFKKNREVDLLYIGAKRGLFEDGLFRFGTAAIDHLESRFYSLWRGM